MLLPKLLCPSRIAWVVIVEAQATELLNSCLMHGLRTSIADADINLASLADDVFHGE
jgi:hypothetical protein